MSDEKKKDEKPKEDNTKKDDVTKSPKVSAANSLGTEIIGITAADITAKKFSTVSYQGISNHDLIYDPMSVLDNGKIRFITGERASDIMTRGINTDPMVAGVYPSDRFLIKDSLLSNIGSIEISKPDYLKYYVSDINSVPTSAVEQQKVDDEINGLKKERVELLEELRDSKKQLDSAKKKLDEGTKAKQDVAQIKMEYDLQVKEYEAKISAFEDKTNELLRNERLNHIRGCVNEDARILLKESEDFRKLFEETSSCDSFVLAIDLRRSTDLMLKARSPKLFSKFIISLCEGLHTIIVRNYGIFEKFTGDGVLAFFPDFYSGKDSGLLAIRTSTECHSFFMKHYYNHRACFNSVLNDVGLGIGIDFGNINMVKLNQALSIVGTPVVYACRMSGAKANQTLANQPAYEMLSGKYSQYLTIIETYLDIKHEGQTLAYDIKQSKPDMEAVNPDWTKSISKK